MRHLALLLGLLLILATPALAGVVVVDPFSQTVETTRVLVQFDYDQPDLLRQVYDRTWDPAADLAYEENSYTEFWGQSMLGTSSQGFIRPNLLVSHSWEVTAQSDRVALITTVTRSEGQPVVRTRYWFIADEPYFLVERTIEFSGSPYSGSYQAYVARVALADSYRAIRYRDVTGALQQRGYCITPCEQASWNGRWVEHVGYRLGVGHAVAMIYPSSVVPGTTLVRGIGPEIPAGWAAPLSAGGAHTQDETSRCMIAFSSRPDHPATMDSLWSVYNSGSIVLDAPRTLAPGLRLAVAPNPARGPATISWSLPRAGRTTVEVHDLAGRRIATLFEGDAPSGESHATWDGRDGAHEASAGLYWVRLACPDGVRTQTLVRVR